VLALAARQSVSKTRVNALVARQREPPGLSGTPVRGHSSRAATRASCASSSASPTSRVIRARPAMSFACSIRKTAWIVRWISVAVTATDHIIVAPSGQDG